MAFNSNATNLVSGDNNLHEDIFVHDRLTGSTELVSIASDGAQANDQSWFPSISADGRYVAFQSGATNLVSGDTNGWSDIFVHDRQTGTTERISIASDGSQGNGDSPMGPSSISADGRFVAFISNASNLVSNDTNGTWDLFIHDRQTDITERASVASDGTQANGLSYMPSLSANGRFVTFYSFASNLIIGDTNTKVDIFVHDRQTEITERVSVNSDGSQGNDYSEHPSISGDGKFVAFSSLATNMVSGDTNGIQDIFVHTLPISTSYSISGRVTDASGYPMQGVYISAGVGYNTLTDSHGDYFLTDLAAGSYTVTPSLAGFVSWPKNKVVTLTSANVANVDFNILYSQGDSDGDGLLNKLEVLGYDANNDGKPEVDLPAMGANPLHKDIFVEVDYMEKQGICLPIIGCSQGHTHKPKPGVFEKAVQIFADSGVSNPDGITGIALHVDDGPDSIMDPIKNITWGAYSQSNAIAHTDWLGSMNGPIDYDWTDFNALKTKYFISDRAHIFHYTLFIHKGPYSVENFINKKPWSGISAGIPGSDFIVSLGSANGDGTLNQQVGTFVHELGHNLGLHHGGGDDINLKPNYLSIMNYSFQMRGLIIDSVDGTYNYSHFDLPDLYKDHLNEIVGLNGGTQTDNYGTVYFCPDKSERLISRANAPINWNCNDNNTETDVQANINNDNNPQNKILSSYDDWSHLIFNGGSIGMHPLMDQNQPNDSDPVEITLEEDAMLISQYSVVISGDDNLVAPKGYLVNYALTITNKGINDDIYTLTAVSDKGWADLSGLPAEFSLTAGTSQTLMLAVQIPATVSGGESEHLTITLTSHGNSNFQDVKVIQTTVVATIYLPMVGKNN